MLPVHFELQDGIYFTTGNIFFPVLSLLQPLLPWLCAPCLKQKTIFILAKEQERILVSDIAMNFSPNSNDHQLKCSVLLSDTVIMIISGNKIMEFKVSLLP